MHQNHDNLESEFLQYASIVELTEGQEMSIAGVKSTIDIVKTFLDAKDAKSMRVITALDIELSNLETELANKNRELLAKDKEISQLKERLASIDKPKLVEQLIYKDPFWFAEEDESQTPICRNCTDKENRFIYLQKNKLPMGSQSMYICSECQTKTLA